MAAALTPLEGATLDVTGLRIVRGALAGLTDEKGLLPRLLQVGGGDGQRRRRRWTGLFSRAQLDDLLQPYANES